MKTYEIETHDGGLFGRETYFASAMNITTAISRALKARISKAKKLKQSGQYGIYVTSAKELDAYMA